LFVGADVADGVQLAVDIENRERHIADDHAQRPPRLRRLVLATDFDNSGHIARYLRHVLCPFLSPSGLPSLAQAGEGPGETANTPRPCSRGRESPAAANRAATRWAPR